MKTTMKMNPICFGFMAVCVLSSTSVFAQAVAPAKALELALHRLEKLVILKKIDASFQTKMKSMKIELIAHATSADPSYKTTIYQLQGSDGSSKALEVIMNEEGKTISSQVYAGVESNSATVWPDKDAVTLSEDALHYVIDNATTNPMVAPFNAYATTLNLSQSTDSQGKTTAVVLIKNSINGLTLKEVLAVDGTFISASVLADEAQP